MAKTLEIIDTAIAYANAHMSIPGAKVSKHFMMDRAAMSLVISAPITLTFEDGSTRPLVVYQFYHMISDLELATIRDPVSMIRIVIENLEHTLQYEFDKARDRGELKEMLSSRTLKFKEIHWGTPTTSHEHKPHSTQGTHQGTPWYPYGS